MTWVFLAWLIPMIIGGGVWAYLRYSGARVDFSPWAGVGVAVVLFFCSWGIVALITHMSIQQAVTFHENWGGYEVKAYVETTTCSQDGPCVHEYDCDPYQVHVVDQAAYTDDKGNYHPEVSHWETRYHSCPYTTEEYTYRVLTTLGDYVIESHWLPEHPNAHRWRSGHEVPSDLPAGVPQFWQQAYNRISAGDPGPVVKRMDYENYILASQHTILKQYSSSIEKYRKANQLPALSHNPVHDPYYADKVFFVGVQPPGNWQYELNQFDAALGMDLQGDMYVVIVDANKISDPDDYMMALTAYWTSEEHFGKDALAKNGIIVVVGTKNGGKTVDWARAKTGMPVGNEAMILDVRDKLPGTALTPAALLGHPRASRLYIKPGSHHYSVDIAHTDGALERLVWGEHKFERVCMSCEGKDETGQVGYKYLKNEIQPGGVARFLMIFFTLLVGLGLWYGAFAFYNPDWLPSSSSRY